MLKKKECKINKNEHLNSLNIGNNNISILLKNILRLYNNNTVVNVSELMFFLSRSTRIYISTLNEYFKSTFIWMKIILLMIIIFIKKIKKAKFRI